MLINLRNAMLGGKKSPLPPGARWVEYLESSGTQWINTDIIPNAQTKWVLDAMFPDANSFNPMGVLFTNPIRRFIIALETGDRANVSFGTYDNILAIPARGMRKVFELDAPNMTWRIDDTSGSFTQGTFDITGIGRIYLFTRNRNGGVEYRNNGSRVYACQIYDSGALVRDFRPIAIDTTGYMLDLVSGEYLPYGNKGTGDFVIGPDVNAPST